MKGLIFNLLLDMASRAGCQEEAWDVALLTAGGFSAGRSLFDEGTVEFDEEEPIDLAELAAIRGQEDSFRSLMRSAPSFSFQDFRRPTKAIGDAGNSPPDPREPVQLSLFPDDEIERPSGRRRSR